MRASSEVSTSGLYVYAFEPALLICTTKQKYIKKRPYFYILLTFRLNLNWCKRSRVHFIFLPFKNEVRTIKQGNWKMCLVQRYMPQISHSHVSYLMHLIKTCFNSGRNYAVNISIVSLQVVPCFYTRLMQMQLFCEGRNLCIPIYQYASVCHVQTPQVPLHPFRL